MKTMLPPLLALIAALGFAVTAALAHGEKKEAGPNGGRILASVTPRAEFLVTKERRIQITFLGQDGKPVAPAGQTVSVTTGSRTSPTILKFRPQGTVLVSEGTLPAGNNLPAVVELRTAPEAAAVFEKFNLNLTVCPGCQLAEYACTCDHH